MKIHSIFIELFFMDVRFHEPGLINKSRLIFMKIHDNILWVFIELTPWLSQVLA